MTCLDPQESRKQLLTVPRCRVHPSRVLHPFTCAGNDRGWAGRSGGEIPSKGRKALSVLGGLNEERKETAKEEGAEREEKGQ